jgi:uncharacterized protein YchJ
MQWIRVSVTEVTGPGREQRSESALAADSPAALMQARCRAFQAGDFGFIYDSYHSASNFRRQFDDREAYQSYGQTCLAEEFRIIDWRLLDQQADADEAAVVVLMTVVYQGVRQTYAELAWLKKERHQWRYHRGQRMSAEELPEEPDRMKIGDFAKLDPNTVF